MTLHDRIKQLRFKQDLTLSELSKRSGVGKATLSRIENGQSLGTTKVLIKIAKAFNIDFREFIAVVDFE